VGELAVLGEGLAVVRDHEDRRRIEQLLGLQRGHHAPDARSSAMTSPR
jgi:hypothetical protein